ncbi:hypothetical protein G5C51_29415 [Streptomyces sp. A7024]|uniref:Protein kinase domain-containing protein n=1 Tax=Streptomyces coryli TaxID=1128680 RepID=A0A6G4U8H3_9ACTN|nr:hypothetical protein [Streptomyces coryli]NGN68006.1 hypothetical protein [Streptomyces coryli]
MLRCVSRGGREWRLGERLGSGSEGVVYAVTDAGPGGPLVAKLIPEPADRFRPRVDALVRQGREPRTVRLLAGAPGRLAWPLERITAPGAAGYLMRDLRAHFRPFGDLLITAARQERLPEATWATALATAAALAGLLADIHAEDYVVGDLKPDNLWADGRGGIAMADVDSWQFTDRGAVFPGRMRTPGYAAPELLGRDSAPPTSASDDFVLAVLVHQLLMSGLHPFTGHPGDDSPYLSLDDNLRHGRSRLLSPGSVVLPASAPPDDVLPRELRQLLTAALGGPGRKDPAARPAAVDWARALRRQLRPERLATCRANGSHVHTRERPWCPWCDQAERGWDSYPGARTAEGAR